MKNISPKQSLHHKRIILCFSEILHHYYFAEWSITLPFCFPFQDSGDIKRFVGQNTFPHPFCLCHLTTFSPNDHGRIADQIYKYNVFSVSWSQSRGRSRMWWLSPTAMTFRPSARDQMTTRREKKSPQVSKRWWQNLNQIDGIYFVFFDCFHSSLISSVSAPFFFLKLRCD